MVNPGGAGDGGPRERRRKEVPGDESPPDYRKGSGGLCALTSSSNHFWKSSAVRTVTNPRILAWPNPQSCAQAISYWNSAFPVRVRISAVVTLGTTQIGMGTPGIPPALPLT